MDNNDFTIYRCTGCGYVQNAEKTGAIGAFHAHAEKHTGFLSIANVEKLMQYTQKLRITEYEKVPINSNG